MLVGWGVNQASPSVSAWALVLVGAATGVLAGLLGVGGGIIMVPVLAALGYTRYKSNAISLATILLVATSGAIGFAVSGAVDFPYGLAVGAGGVVGATYGARWMNVMSGPTLARVFGAFLIVIGVRMLIGGGISTGEPLIEPPVGYLVAVLIGVIAGVASGLAGIGGGVIMVPAMVYLLGLSQHSAEGTSLVAIIFTAAAATKVNVGNSHVEWKVVWLLGVSGVIMAPLAALAAQRISADTLARIFGIWVLAAAIHTIWQARSN